MIKSNKGRKPLPATAKKIQVVGAVYLSIDELKALGFKNISDARAAANQAVRNYFRK